LEVGASAEIRRSAHWSTATGIHDMAVDSNEFSIFEAPGSLFMRKYAPHPGKNKDYI
jgi:hypothetical protein